jgi:hypothetical protein
VYFFITNSNEKSYYLALLKALFVTKYLVKNCAAPVGSTLSRLTVKRNSWREKMLYLSRKTLINFIVICITLAFTMPAWSEEITIINAAPNKAVCKSKAIRIGEESVKSELCVSQKNFSHDKYVLKFNDELISQGIDDQTTSGLNASYKNRQVLLRCPPQEVPPNATVDEIHKLVPSYSSDKAKNVAELMKGSNMPIEIGRLCQITIDNEDVMKVQVHF